MGQMTIKKVTTKLTYDSKEAFISLLLDQGGSGREIYGIDTDDGREVYLYAEEIEAAYQMLQKLKELNSKD
ncbi:hypothetical protein [Acinetobacter sp. YH12255]|uniref:hypothetical protein n=1 Tax=Acinetobacter sp. YH12255 TaxID=2601179 RepID=UPI0015D36BA7|nr:hypothetical protein [Acinetobacter sp. YH12255]